MSLLTSKAVTGILLLTLLLGMLYYMSQSLRSSDGHFKSSEFQLTAPDELENQFLDLHLDLDPLQNLMGSSFVPGPTPPPLQYKQPSIIRGRTDVVSVTPWLAPVVWEGTFNPVLLDSIYKRQNVSVAATVFAVGKYIMFLKNFLETAEQHFFVGFNLHIYVFTDRPKEVPQVKMATGRQLTVCSVPSSRRWQDISARRMELIQTLIEETLHHHDNYIFCLDVDSQFHGRWGTESLGGLVAVIHPGYYKDDCSSFPYERRPQSRAHMAPGQGDFYYCGGAFGGLLREVHLLAKTCRSNFEADAKEGIEAAWQEESHLNRYMWIHKPSKVLSPEYLWQDFKSREPEIHIIRFSGVVKNYADIRPNV